MPYLYLLRVQIVTALILIFLPPLARSSSLLNGLFDLDYANNWKSAVVMTSVSLASFATAWTLLATCWTAIFNAPERFGTARIAFVRFPIRWRERAVFGLMALSPIINAILHSYLQSAVSRAALIAGAVVGVAVTIVALLTIDKTAEWLQREIHKVHPRTFVARGLRRLVSWVADQPNIREGFIDLPARTLRPGHMIAWVGFVASMLLYLGIGIGKYVYIGYQATIISTLACVLLLVLMLCWMFAGIAFFFDRYRVPVLLPFLAFPLITAWLPWSDHFYRTMPATEFVSPMPHQVLTLGADTPILIAATGGGIHASAWTARVLTGIAQTLPADLQQRYAHSIRFVSTVSGGGVGAMYFLQKYDHGHLSTTGLEDVVDLAEASSLEDVAWGAAYPDFLRMFLPLPFKWAMVDRGQALEWAWTRNAGLARPLSEWREEVWSDHRPANIFNATVVDTGERLLIGTTRVGWSKTAGLQNFEDTYPRADIQVVTAARLSASFTYISPAARADLPDRRYHIVDGGYYDDYGMTTLTEWLDEALEGTGGTHRRVLVIQIRASPETEDLNPDEWHGWFYQALAPAEALMNVRSTAQLSRNDEEFARLQTLWSERGVEINNVVFRYCGEHPPLSWHMTGKEKEAIAEAWFDHLGGPALRAVRAFLLGQPIPDASPEKPLDARMMPCTKIGRT